MGIKNMKPDFTQNLIRFWICPKNKLDSPKIATKDFCTLMVRIQGLLLSY